MMFSHPTEPVDFRSAFAVIFMWGVEEKKKVCQSLKETNPGDPWK